MAYALIDCEAIDHSNIHASILTYALGHTVWCSHTVQSRGWRNYDELLVVYYYKYMW